MLRMASSSSLSQYAKPLVVVMGATGTGKTKLAVELCVRFDGEVIGTDSIQVYEGLDIATNKATTEEMCGVPHHMMGFLSPTVTAYNVINFRDRALGIMEDIWQRNKVPVLVGGTSYYMESLLWKHLLTDDLGKVPVQTVTENMTQTIPKQWLNLSNSELHAQLMSVDPTTAVKLHPNNRKRVLTALQSCHFHGQPRSELLRKQTSQEGASPLGGPLRFRNSVMLWLRTDSKVLNNRINDRVEQMVKNGLRKEIEQFYDTHFHRYNAEINNVKEIFGVSASDPCSMWPKGIFQAIGLKEFQPFLRIKPENRTSAEAETVFSNCLEDLKLRTRQYARRQNKWVLNRLLRRPDREVPAIYAFDVNSPDCWKEAVRDKAFDVVDSLLKGGPCAERPFEVEQLSSSELETRDDRVVRRCLVCDTLIEGAYQWLEHHKGRKHRNLKSARLQQERNTLVASLDQFVASGAAVPNDQFA